MRHWLFKSEPDCYSFTDLENAPGQTTSWDAVRIVRPATLCATT